MAGGEMFTVARTLGTMLCWKCSIPMHPNAPYTCANCLRSEVDITGGLQKLVDIHYCPECQRFQQPHQTWIKAELESNELLTFCLKRLTMKSDISLKEAKFIWTEPHSKRIKIRLTVKKEVLRGVSLEQAYTVEYHVHDFLCESCTRTRANPDQWEAVVQLRQYVPHRRTFFFLEQLILKHNASKDAIRIKQMNQGIDFFFGNDNHALKFKEFAGKVAPTILRSTSKQLVSHDTKSNTENYKYTYSVEISPVCREDLICLPPKVAVSLGNLGPLVICHKVSNRIALLDPFTLRECFLDAEQYRRSPFKALLSSRQLTEYIVLDLEPITGVVVVGGSKYVLADAEVARVSDFGKNDRRFVVRTHLGNRLSVGDYALGYDLYGANCNDVEFDKYTSSCRYSVPDVILIKKSYEEKRRKGRSRSWKLKSLDMEVNEGDNEEKRDSEYEQFLRDLEENPELRFNLSLYRDKEHRPSEMDDDDEVPRVPLDELLADLDLADDDDDDDVDMVMAE